MALSYSFRQTRAFTETCDLYRPDVLTVDADSVVDYVGYNVANAPTATGVLCHFEKRREGSAPTGYGRSDQDILDTTDRLHVHQGVDIGDGWYVKVTSGFYSGKWFVCQGEEQTLEWRGAKDKTILVKPALKPPGV
jgi:hypothetical protein